LTHEGYRRRYGRRLPGQPDIVFIKKRVAVFVDGCFWHGCAVCDTGVDHASVFWQDKIATNKERDRRTTGQLQQEGWKVVRIPEHEVKTKAGLQETSRRLAGLLESLDQNREEES
jgi:DNA mismatch endonuclease (patch repair protein)